MGFKQSRSYLMEVKSNDNNILSAWDWLIERLTSEESAYLLESHRYSEEMIPDKYITIISSHGNNYILVKMYGQFDKESDMRSVAKEIMLEALGEAYKEAWKGWSEDQKIPDRAVPFIRRSMNISVQDLNLPKE